MMSDLVLVMKIPILKPVRRNGANTIKFATRNPMDTTNVSSSALATKTARGTSAYRDATTHLVPIDASAWQTVQKEATFVSLAAHLTTVTHSALLLRKMEMRLIRTANLIAQINCASIVFMKAIVVPRLIVHLRNVNTTVC
jgi:hypothetical protein